MTRPFEPRPRRRIPSVAPAGGELPRRFVLPRHFVLLRRFARGDGRPASDFCMPTRLPFSMRTRPQLLTLWLAMLLLLAGCDTGIDPNADPGDDGPTVQFATSATTVTESDSTASLTVELVNPDGVPVSVDLLFAQDAGNADVRDLNLPGDPEANGLVLRTITFPGTPEAPNEETFTFDVTDDDNAEPRETAQFALQNLATRGGATLGDDRVFRLEIGFPTLREVRDENDLGDLISVQATVTRARGSFTYVQDESGAGLTIRQTSGAFNQAVGSGDIAPGTQLQVTGTLDTFAGLLQINEDGLNDYSILGQGETPDPTTVTLADVSGETGETYESSLVRIENLTFSTGGSFANGTNYDVSDGTATLVARVPNAGDTELGGTPIPSGPVTFTGIVGQFNGSFDSNANGGYQLLLINADDIQ